MKKLLIITSEYFHPLRYRLHHILPFLIEKFEIKIIVMVPLLYDAPSEAMRSRVATIKLLIKTLARNLIQEQNHVLTIRNLLYNTRIDFISQIVNAVIAAWVMKLKNVYDGFDVCLASAPVGGFSALLTKMPIPIVYEDVDRFEFFENICIMKRVLKFFERYCIRNSAEVVSAGFNLAKSAEVIRGKRVHCIPNGINLKLFRNEYSTGRDRFAIVYVGSIAQWCGLELAIKSLPLIISDFPEAKLIVVGTGNHEYIGKLKTLAKKLDISDKVIFFGPKKYEEIPLMISKCGIGLATFPKTELMRYAFSFKVIEYMAAGLPVIATDFGDTGKIIQKYKCGVLVECTPESIADGIKKLLKDKEYMVTLAENARRFSKEFDLKPLAQREIKILSELACNDKQGYTEVNYRHY